MERSRPDLTKEGNRRMERSRPDLTKEGSRRMERSRPDLTKEGSKRMQKTRLDLTKEGSKRIEKSRPEIKKEGSKRIEKNHPDLSRERSKRIETRDGLHRQRSERGRKPLPKESERVSGSNIGRDDLANLNRSHNGPKWGSMSLSHGIDLEGSQRRGASLRGQSSSRQGRSANRRDVRSRSRSTSVSRRRRNDVVSKSQHQQMLALAATSCRDLENSADLEVEPDLFLTTATGEGACATKDPSSSAAGSTEGDEETEESDKKSILKKMKGKISKVLGPSAVEQGPSD